MHGTWGKGIPGGKKDKKCPEDRSVTGLGRAARRPGQGRRQLLRGLEDLGSG